MYKKDANRLFFEPNFTTEMYDFCFEFQSETNTLFLLLYISTFLKHVFQKLISKSTFRKIQMNLFFKKETFQIFIKIFSKCLKELLSIAMKTE